VLSVAPEAVYYSASLTKETVDKHKLPAESQNWTPQVEVPSGGKLKNAKGVTFCGKKDDQWNHYSQVLVADHDAKKVWAWDWVPKADAKNPWEAELKNGWVAYDGKDYQQDGYTSAPTDVKCGPGGGAFVADQGNNAIYWIPYDDLAAKQEGKIAKPIVDHNCGNAVADVRSLSWDADNKVLAWSNDAEAPEKKAVFEYGISAAPSKVTCDKVACDADAWDENACGKGKIEKADVAWEKKEEKAWAVVQAWGKTLVSKGDNNLYDAEEKVKDVYAEAVGDEVTYAVAAKDKGRDVVFAADQKGGDIYAVQKGGASKKIGAVDDVYGVAYNDAYGWQGMDVLADSAATVALSIGSIVALVAALL